MRPGTRTYRIRLVEAAGITVGDICRVQIGNYSSGLPVLVWRPILEVLDCGRAGAPEPHYLRLAFDANSVEQMVLTFAADDLIEVAVPR